MSCMPQTAGKPADAGLVNLPSTLYVWISSINGPQVQQLKGTDGLVSQAVCCGSIRALFLSLIVQILDISPQYRITDLKVMSVRKVAFIWLE